MKITVYWKALGPTKVKYKVFNHVIGTDNVFAGQHDAEPLDGRVPTTIWQRNEVISDAYAIPIRSDAAPGLQLRIGMYNPDSGIASRWTWPAQPEPG